MKKLSKELIQQDIKEFQGKLEKIHPNPYRCISKNDLKISEIVRSIKDGNFQNIIIDLRNNRGGDSDVLSPLVRFLKESKCIYKVFVLVGIDTYSSGIINLLELCAIDDAVSIGEIPHGNPTHYGEVVSFVLSNSKLKVFLLSSKIFRFKGYRLGESFKPTFVVNTEIQDILNGRDTQMEFVRENILLS